MRTSSTFKKCVALFALLSTGATFCKANGEVADTRELYREYISLRKVIGEERSDWESEKVILRDMIEVVQAEINQTKEAIQALEESASAADQRRVDLHTELEAAQQASTAFNATIAEFETRIVAIARLLPDTLKREISPLESRIPDDPTNTRLSYSQRIQNVVGILAQVDKFNSDLRFATEIKGLEDGSHEVQTLYFGLANALFSNPAGTYAGYGKPGAGGWDWVTVSGDEAAAVATAVEIYSARRAPAFIAVPLAVD